MGKYIDSLTKAQKYALREAALDYGNITTLDAGYATLRRLEALNLLRYFPDSGVYELTPAGWAAAQLLIEREEDE